MNASEFIYMCCNTKRNIMKKQVVSPNLGSRGKIFMYICFMFYALTIVYFLFFKNWFVDNFCTGLKPTFGIRVVSASRGRLCY